MAWSEAFTRGYTLIIDKLQGWFEVAVKMLPNLVLAVLLVVVGSFIARLVRSIVYRGLTGAKLAPSTARVLAGTARLGIILATLFVALSILQLDKAVTSLLAGAGVIGLALSFAFQDLAGNFISGLFLSIQRPLKIGDYVRTNDYTGHVKHIGLRAMTIEDLDGQSVIIPSKDIFQNPVVNYSTVARRRVNLNIGVSYAANLEQVEEVTKEAVTAVEAVLDDMPVAVHYNGFGGSSIDFTLRFWVGSSEQSDFNAALSAVLKAVKAAYDAHDITIPFPIRTIDFGIEGGRTADEVALQVIDGLKSPQSSK